MGSEKTLSIIKPDAVSKNVIGEIYTRFEKAGLKVVAAKMTHLSVNQAEIFYGIHRNRPFFSVPFSILGPKIPPKMDQNWTRNGSKMDLQITIILGYVLNPKIIDFPS